MQSEVLNTRGAHQFEGCIPLSFLNCEAHILIDTVAPRFNYAFANLHNPWQANSSHLPRLVAEFNSGMILARCKSHRRRIDLG
jgi:hypothetical protein